MSKKMLKRSLALGALMAFVITGSAMAAELDTDNAVTKNKYFGDYTLKNPSVELTSVGTDYVLGKMSSGVQTTVEVASEESLKLQGNGSYAEFGLIQNTTITGNGSVEIIQESSTTCSSAIGRGWTTGNKVNITANYIKLKSGYDAIYAVDQNDSIELKANTIIIEGGKVGVYTDGSNAKTNISASESLTITGPTAARSGNGAEIIIGSVDGEGKADIMINGNIESVNDAFIDVKLETQKSYLTGSVKAFSAATASAGADRNLTLSNGATWNVTGVSDVTTLSGEGGNIVVNDVNEEQVIIGTDNTKKLSVAATADAKGITGDAKKDLEAVSKTVVTGAGENKKAAADTAQITGGSVYDVISADIQADGTLGEINKEIASANLSVNDMVAIGMMSWRAEMNDMNKRMGELRNANGEHGVWVRMVRGESEYNSVKNQYNQYQLGYDEKLSVDKRWTVGAALSYTDAENNFAEGTGESTNKAFSVYGSKLNNDGTFVDLIAKYARLDNDFKTLQGQGAAEYDTNAYSFSAEVGKRIQQGKGLWIEPQVELTYGKVSAVDYVTAKGVNVVQDGMESLVGRIGFSLGKDIEKGNVYARASYLYDFDGETKAVLDGDAVLTNDLGGGWWEVGVGANINLSKATYIYADVEKTFGGEVDTNWQWNLGVRYSF